MHSECDSACEVWLQFNFNVLIFQKHMNIQIQKLQRHEDTK